MDESSCICCFKTEKIKNQLERQLFFKKKSQLFRSFFTSLRLLLMP